MKRWLTQTMAGLLLLGLMGCGGTPAAAPTPEVTPEPTPQQTPEAPTSASVLLTDVGNQMSLMTPADWPRYRAEEGNQVYYIYQGDTTQSTLFSISSYEAVSYTHLDNLRDFTKECSLYAKCTSMHSGTSDDTAKHIAPALVRWHNSVRN